MKVTIGNYTECCLRTWGGENQKERAELGIIGEMGEVCEVRKKYLRGDYNKKEYDKRTLKELGDVLYYSAIDLHLDIDDDCGFFTYANFAQTYDRYDYTLCKLSSVYQKRYFELDGYEESIIRFVIDVAYQHGFSLQQVMQANIDKLTARANKGLIKGDGSDR